jgi:hypothetical protein
MYDYSKTVVSKLDMNIIVICKIHGDFTINGRSHKNGSGCKICSKENQTKNKYITTEKFISKAKSIWGNKYDYSQTKYVSCFTKINYRCPDHGEISQLSNNHYRFGCPKCPKNNRKENSIKIYHQQFIEKASIIHNNKYDYSNVKYINGTEKVKIICKEHGEFMCAPHNHLRGKGCAKCGLLQITIKKTKCFEYYHKKFIENFGNKYDYSSVKWINGSTKIDVICPNHGMFKINPYEHMVGKTCRQCKSAGFSKCCIEWLKFMEVFNNISIQYICKGGEFVVPQTRYRADGYCISNNTIYEFHGDFWHGNPKRYNSNDINPISGRSYGELYLSTIKKREVLQSLDYNIVEIWESKWKKIIKYIRLIQKKWKHSRIK